MENDIGVVGMAVMGSNLALNMADHGAAVAVYNYTPDLTEKFIAEEKHEKITAYYELEAFVSSLKRPRKIMLMIMAGAPVDMMLEQLLPFLAVGDVVIDGGNSYYGDTQRRFERCQAEGIHFCGVGISGGAAGARFGPAIMPGGSKEGYGEIKGFYEAIAAKAEDGKPCCAYIGAGGAGHFVKMVHNGIEYADMQLIAEAYLLLKHVGHFTNREIADVFRLWNQGELKSFLIATAVEVFAADDDLGTGQLIDKIADCAGQKGTGRWTSIEAMRLGVDISLITAACNARVMSNASGRAKGQKSLVRPTGGKGGANLVETIRKSLYTAKIVAYAQGFSLYKKASEAYGWDLDYGRIAAIFRAGCIIRAEFLNKITAAYETDPALDNLLFAPFFLKRVNEGADSLRQIVSTAVCAGVPIPAYANAVEYLDAYASPQVGANVIQGLRDYFGAHTYRRLDRDGAFHYEWGLHD